jgi:hypothetical protein
MSKSISENVYASKESNETDYAFRLESECVTIRILGTAMCNPEDKFDIQKGISVAQQKIVKELLTVIDMLSQ